MDECQTCGACCFSRLATYVRVTGDDHQRLGSKADALTQFVGNRCFMRMHERGHCAALVVQGSQTFSCSVYEHRPAVCRELERGSPACDAEKLLKHTRTREAVSRPSLLPVL